MSRAISRTRADGRMGFTRYAANPAVSACVRCASSSKAVTAMAEQTDHSRLYDERTQESRFSLRRRVVTKP